MNHLPQTAQDFLIYMETIKGKSSNTIKAYAYDLTLFFKFLKIKRNLVSTDINFDNILISDIDLEFIQKVNLGELYSFLSYVANARSNKNHARARKVACLRSFFRYLQTKAKLIEENPALELEPPKTNTRHPIHLSLDESRALLSSVDGSTRERDYAMITLFLNCGLRLSELVGIDIDRISGDTLTVIGKGNKERTVYLNDSCIAAINGYLKVRPVDGVKDRNALFISKKKRRISKRTVQEVIKKYIKLAGLNEQKFTVHKLRHTAATLMYKYGNVDIRALQQILGHESVSTTQIYTHVDDERLRQAIRSNPLSDEK